MALGVGEFANCGASASSGRLRLLLGSACVAALLLGTGTPPAVAACAINDVGNSAGAGPFNNTTNSINCINIQNSTVNGGTGNVANTAPGVIITAKTAASFSTGIRINNSTLTGSVVNTGTITATTGSGAGIVVVSGASVAGGITNSGSIRAVSNGIEDGVEAVANVTFSNGVTNTGTIIATGFISAGISSSGVSTFTGGISNGGVISANLGITLGHVSTFSGGISNSGTIVGSFASLGLPVGISVDGTGHIAGAAPATFAGGITNTGLVAGGIGVEDFATFAGGNISNQGTITSTRNGIVLTNIVTFAGNVTNSGTVSAGGVGIFVGLTQFSSGGVSTFSGNVVNSGTITAQTGISIVSGTIQGAIVATGNVLASSRGILIDSASKITSTGTAVNIRASTFTGGVSNAGTIASGPGSGIAVAGVTTFTGGITNSGLVVAVSHALGVTSGTVTFAGGITNTGTLSAHNTVLLVSNVAVFGTNATGGITNIGTITGLSANGIQVTTVSTFNGGIVNSGTIAAPSAAINAAVITTFSGGVTNSGTITAGLFGIRLNTISTFTGNISNAGTITAPIGITVSGVTLAGAIIDSGNILASSRGIQIFSTSKITATGTAVAVTGSTFTGGISSAGTLSAGGVGILVNGVATFTGGIINAGLIDPKTGIGVTNTTSFSGGVVNASGATINATAIGINVSGVSTFTGNVSNAGTITGPTGIKIAGSTIAGAIIDTGNLLATSHGISIDSASKITSAASAVAISGATFLNGIRNQGTISGAVGGINVSGSSTFTGGIGNGGAILSNGIGVVVQSVPFFSGDISNAGTISAAAGIAIGSGVVFHGGAAIVNSGNITGTGGTAIDVSLATSPVTIDQTAGTIAGAIKLSTNADVLNVSGGAINGNIVGQGSTNTVNFALGAGTFTYGSNFTGINQVNINSGTVILNGANSATKVDVNGGTLAGAGSIDPVAVTIHSGATFAPGTPGTPGTAMSIVGTLTFQPGATYQVYLNPSASTAAIVTGAATLAGTVQANFLPGGYVTRSYHILHSGGLGGTTFAGLTTIPANFNATLSYTTTDVLLNLTAGLGQATGLTVNQQNVATTINTFFNNGGALPPGFATVFNLTGASLANALNQLDGEVATGSQRAGFQIESEFLSLLIDPFVYGRGDAVAGAYGGMLGFAPEAPASQPAGVALPYASVLKAPPPPTFAQRWTAWGAAYGGQASAKGDPVIIGSTNVTTGTFGFAAGMDYRVSPDTVVGFGLGAGGTGWGLAQGMGSGRSDALQAGVYGATHRGPVYAAAAVAFAENWMSTSRTAFGDQLTADFTGQSVGLRLEGGYRLPLMLDAAALGVAPYAAVQTQWFHTPTYSERDLVPAGFGLTYQAQTANDTRSELGLRADALTAFNGMPLLLRGRLAWAHDWVSNPALSAVFQALPGTSFVVFGAPVAHDTALASAGAELRITPRLDLIAKFDGEFAAGAQTYAGSGVLRYRW